MNRTEGTEEKNNLTAEISTDIIEAKYQGIISSKC